MRYKNEKHLKFIRDLPCIICGNDIETEACHIRMADARLVKPITGNSIKPDDYWTLPMCGFHHRCQHYWNEYEFWKDRKIDDPCLYALRLFSVSGDYQKALDVLKVACRYDNGYIAKIEQLRTAIRILIGKEGDGMKWSDRIQTAQKALEQI